MQKYSVLMSLYQKEHPEYFREFFNSMINQTVKPDEIVLVEDGPLTEELYQVVAEYQEKYNELFHVVVNKENLGLGLALNKGLMACRNELVARMDTDDISDLARCEMQVEYFNKYPETAILGGQIEEFLTDTIESVGRRIVPETDADIKLFMKKRCPFNHMTVMFKKSAVLDAGNYQDWFWNEDYYLWVRMMMAGCRFANIPDVAVNVRSGADQYARRGGKKYFDSEIGIKKLMLEKGMITRKEYIVNYIQRFIIQLMLPNSVRGWVFRTYARKN